jgi:DNA-directed RNA polymerase specialized sigma24 family protein
VPNLVEMGYLKEVPSSVSWHAMLEDVSKMCRGISMKFKLRTEDEQMELANAALLEVIKKIADYKLVYTPGRAPVFNLLTTTIHRIMYSIMNRRKAQREGLGRILSDAEAGVLPTTHRSLRTQTAFIK